MHNLDSDPYSKITFTANALIDTRLLQIGILTQSQSHSNSICVNISSLGASLAEASGCSGLEVHLLSATAAEKFYNSISHCLEED